MANRIEIIVSAKKDTDVRKIGEEIKKEVTAGASGAGDAIEKEIGDGARDAGKRAETELGNAGSRAGGKFSRNFSAGTQLRDARGRFARAGADMGGAAAAGAGRALTGGLSRAGSQAGSAAASGVRRSFIARVGGVLGSVGRRIGHTFGIHFGSAASDAGQTAGRAATKGFANVFEGGITSPMILIPLIAAAAAAAPLAGAALATGVVLAFGAGLGGLGLIAASRLKPVKKEIKSFHKFTATWLKDIGRPMEGAFSSMLSNARRVLNQFRPALKGAFKNILGPGLERFFTNLGTAFANLKPAIKPIAQAFTDLMDALGPQLPGIFEQISNAIISISETISANPDLFAGIITGLLQLIPLALNIAGALAKAYDSISKFTGTKDMWRNLFDVLSPLGALLDHLGLDKWGPKIKGFFSDLFGGSKSKGKNKMSMSLDVKDNASKVFNKVKGIASGFAKKTWRAVIGAKNTAGRIINAARRTAVNFAKGTYRAAMRAVNRAGSAIAGARKLARNFASATYRAVMRAVNRAGGAVASARAAALRFARATYRALLTARNAVWSAVNSALAAARNWAGRVFTATLRVVKNFSPFAHGGVVGAKATGGVTAAATGGGRGGTVLVGESGPELLNLPGGSHVTSNPDSKRKLAATGSSSAPSKGASSGVLQRWAATFASGISRSKLADRIVDGLGAKLDKLGRTITGGVSSSVRKSTSGSGSGLTTLGNPSGKAKTGGLTTLGKSGSGLTTLGNPSGKAKTGSSGGLAILGKHSGLTSLGNPSGKAKTGSSRTAATGSSPTHVTVQIGSSKLAEVVIDPIRKAVRSKGGNVQAVLGSGRA